MIALLQELVRIPSPSREEGAAADFLEARLRSRGPEPRRCGNNLWCCSGSGPAVLLDAHIDTVRPVSGWTRDPFSASLEDGRLYGLGVSDDGGLMIDGPDGPDVLRSGEISLGSQSFAGLE